MSISICGWGSSSITTVGFGWWISEYEDLIPYMNAFCILDRRTDIQRRAKGVVDERARGKVSIRLKTTPITSRDKSDISIRWNL